MCHIQSDCLVVTEGCWVSRNSAVAYIDNGDSIRILYGIAINAVATDAAEIRTQGGVVVQVGVVQIMVLITLIVANPLVVLIIRVLSHDTSVEGTVVNFGKLIIKTNNSAHILVVVYHIIGDATVGYRSILITIRSIVNCVLTCNSAHLRSERRRRLLPGRIDGSTHPTACDVAIVFTANASNQS